MFQGRVPRRCTHIVAASDGVEPASAIIQGVSAKYQQSHSWGAGDRARRAVPVAPVHGYVKSALPVSRQLCKVCCGWCSELGDEQASQSACGP